MADQFQYVKLPNGEYGKFAGDASDDVIKSAIQKDFPDAFKAAPNAGLAKPPGVPVPDALKAVPGLGSRFSQMFGADLPPLQQALSEGVQFAQHPLDTSYQAGKQIVTGARDLAYGLTTSPIETAKTVSGGPQFSEDMKNGNYRGAVGTLLGGAAQVAMMKAGARGEAPITSVEQLSKANLPKQMVVSQSDALRKIANNINPAAEEVPAVERSLSTDLGNAQKFAAENGIDFSKRQQAVKGFRGAAEERSAHYKNNIVGPNEDVVVPRPKGFQGELIDDSPTRETTNVRNLQARLTELNKLSRQPRQAGQTGKVLSGLDSAEEAEAASIRRTLDHTLSEKTGIPASDIGRLRSSIGALHDLADKTNMAVIREQKGETVATRTGSKGIPGTPLGVVDRAWNFARGGAVKIGDRAFTKSLRGLMVDPNEIPQPNYPSPPSGNPPVSRTPVWDGLQGNSTPFGGVETTSPADAADFQAQVQQKGMLRGSLRDMLKASKESDLAKQRQDLAIRKNIARNSGR